MTVSFTMFRLLMLAGFLATTIFFGNLIFDVVRDTLKQYGYRNSAGVIIAGLTSLSLLFFYGLMIYSAFFMS